MNVTKITVFSCALLLSNSSLLWSSAPAASAAAAGEPGVVTGHLYIAKGMLCYLGDPNGYCAKELKDIADDKGKSLELKPEDVMVPIYMEYEKGSFIHPAHYSEPKELPLSVLDNKNEGDPCHLQLKSQTGAKTLRLLMMCKQAGHPDPSDTFQQRLNEYKTSFVRSANHALSDEEMLQQQDILIPNPAYREFPASNGNQVVAMLSLVLSQEPKFLHGPRGFKVASGEAKK